MTAYVRYKTKLGETRCVEGDNVVREGDYHIVEREEEYYPNYRLESDGSVTLLPAKSDVEIEDFGREWELTYTNDSE